MKALALTMFLSLHGLIFTDELTIASKVLGLCFLLTIAAYLMGKSAVKNDDTNDYK
jgi:hypothetical protein